MPSSFATAVSSGRASACRSCATPAASAAMRAPSCDAPGGVARDESVVLERAQQPVGDRAVHAEPPRDLVDRERLARVGEDLQDPDAAAQRLRGRARAASVVMRAPLVRVRRANVYDLFSSRTLCSNIEHATLRSQARTQDLDIAVRGGHPCSSITTDTSRESPACRTPPAPGIDRPDRAARRDGRADRRLRPRGHAARRADVAVPGRHDAHHRAPRRPPRARAGRRHPAAQRRDVPGVRVRRAHRRRGVQHRLHELLGARPREPAATSSAPRAPRTTRSRSASSRTSS